MAGCIRKIPLVLMLFSILSIAGCYQNMVHPTKDSSEWGADHAECEREVRESMRGAPDANMPDLYDYSEENRLIRQCMQRKGWKFKL